MDNLAKEILRDLALEEIAPRTQQHSPVDHWSPPVLLERAAYLKKLAGYGNGAATETLRDYPQHAAMLSFHSRDSEAEMHRDYAILFCVLAGSATLVTGGTMMRVQAVEPGLSRGDSIDGGTHQQLKAGEIAHVPAGLPHQILVAGEKTVTCFMLKIRPIGE
jgi:mannose-6-phosphate isomerase-like protein (cupin superfamily)